MAGTTEFFNSVVKEVAPQYTYQGIPFYNVCHIIEALRSAEILPAGIENHGTDYWWMLVDEAVEALDAVWYEFPKYEWSYTEGVELAIHNGYRAVVMHDLS